MNGSPKNHRPIPAQVVELEKRVEDLTGHVERLQGRISYLSVVSDALVAMMGEETVQAKIDDMHLERLGPIAETHKANTAKAVDEGKIVPTETVAPSSIVVAIERNKRGAITSLRTQIALPLVPELHQLFVGKKAGDIVQVTRNETTMSYELLEVYEPTAKGLGQEPVVEEKPEEAPATPGEAN